MRQERRREHHRTTIVKLDVPTSQFALADTFAAVPEVEFNAVRVTPHGTDRALRLLWATNADAESVMQALDRDTTAAGATLVTRRNRDTLFRMRLTNRVHALTQTLVGNGGAVVSSRGTRDGWTVRVMFPDRSAIASTHEACGEYDITIDRIADLDDTASFGVGGVIRLLVALPTARCRCIETNSTVIPVAVLGRV